MENTNCSPTLRSQEKKVLLNFAKEIFIFIKLSVFVNQNFNSYLYHTVH
uniref:Uncharacterized protein n=1 Tax=Sphingobacterium sp. (strain 21) TaxID=743722 RepID=F4CBQ6_SPHS2